MSSNTQDYDANDASASYEQRGVQKYDGAGDHDGKRWLVCKDEIKSALETWSRRAKEIDYYSSLVKSSFKSRVRKIVSSGS